MNKHKIRLNSTNSINSINTEEHVDVNLKRTSKLFPDLNIVGEVDAYEVFENERNNCHNYRLILTINPFCTNVLFNDLTEITRNEGSPNNTPTDDDGLEVITDEEGSTAQHTGDCYGVVNPNRMQMIMNTEYSKENIGYEYKPGYDFFTNHILRNTTYKIVNMISYDEDNVPITTLDSMEDNGIQDEFCNENLVQKNDETCRKVFNTIGDFMRYSDGTVVNYRKREQINADVSDLLNKHLYLYDEVLTMEDSINNNLTEENGWFGFVNNSTIASKKYTTETSLITGRKIWEDLDISRVLNNKENCEFIDMYPDRTLFSFNPKLNKFRKRLEYNWDIILTYPYKNEYCHKVLTSGDGKTNGLLMMSVTKTLNNSGTNTLMFRSFCKHGLSRGDMINIYVNGEVLSRSIKVTNVGNMSSDNDDNVEFYFYTTDMTLLNEYFNIKIDTETNKWVDENGTELTTQDINQRLNDDNTEYRIRRIVSGIESEYYIRIFRKFPNLKNKKENLTEEVAKDEEAFKNYLYGENGMKENAVKSDDNGSKYMIDFNKEQYKLAFSRTIYSDASTQITFTDTLDTEYIVDNLGRPLHEIYATIIKRNKGYGEWYGVSDMTEEGISKDKYELDLSKRVNITQPQVEYSHCFGRVNSGFEFSNRYDDRYDIELPNKKAEVGDITTLNELGVLNSISYERNITDKGVYRENRNSGEYEEHKDEFYGDIVEFNPSEAEEHVLLPICHRFNTMQRELPNSVDTDNKSIYDKFQYQEIGRDDYDPGNGMEVINRILNEEEQDKHDVMGSRLTEWQRPEGYFYQAHYPIILMEFGQLTQDAHYDMKVRNAKPAQLEGIYISVTTTLRQTISTEDIVYVCFDDGENYRNDKWYEFTVSYVENNTTFYIHPYNMSWKEFSEKTAEDVGVEYNWITLSMAFTEQDTTNEDGTVEYKNVKLRRRNNSIPSYASKINHNMYVWRNMYRPGEMLDSELEVLPFTNNAFYISKEINFFLKRQDPYGISGLYCQNAFINDIDGNMREEDTYYYKSEDEIVC